MAGNLQTMFPQVDMTQSGFVGGTMLGDMFNMAKANNQQNMMDAQQAYEQSAATHPFELQNKRAAARLNDSTAGINEQALLKNQAEFDEWKGQTGPRKQLAEADYVNKLTEAELKTNFTRAQLLMLDPNPAKQKQGMDLYMRTGEIVKMREKARLDKEQAESVARIGASSRAAGSSNEPRPPRSNEEAIAYWNFIAAQALQAGDMQKHAFAVEQSKLAERIKQEQIRARPVEGRVGKVDLANSTPGNIATFPEQPYEPVPRPQAPEAPQPTKITTVEQARQAGWKFMVDGKGRKAYVGPNNQFIEVQ